MPFKACHQRREMTHFTLRGSSIIRPPVAFTEGESVLLFDEMRFS